MNEWEEERLVEAGTSIRRFVLEETKKPKPAA
jgi:hypothetical protein